MYILGIDPGFTGALAVFDASDESTMFVLDMPVTKDPKGRAVLDMYTLFDTLRPTGSVTAILEYVAARPGQSAPATFRFGQGYGAIQMALAAHSIPTHYVTPAKWKKHFGLSKDKGVSRGLAQQRFPHLADQLNRIKDDGRAEAALIALYGKEKLL